MRKKKQKKLKKSKTYQKCKSDRPTAQSLAGKSMNPAKACAQSNFRCSV